MFDPVLDNPVGIFSTGTSQIGLGVNGIMLGSSSLLALRMS
jgi:hypothetical protein